jgi:hypothetical protein
MPTKITYNGKTTELGAKCIATLSCKDYTMATDVVIEAPQSEGAKLYGIDVTPTKEIQNIVPEDNYDGFDEVIVNPIPDEYIDTSDATATADKILKDETAYVNGEKVTGSIETYDGDFVEETEDELQGVWLLNENLTKPTHSYTFLNFISNNKVYTEMQHLGSLTALQYEYTDTVGNWNVAAPANATSFTWNNDAYRTLTVLSKRSEVSDKSFEWFTTNATKIAAFKIITFTIDGVSYSAKEGMTWGEWIKSSYNTGGFTIGLYNFIYSSDNTRYITDVYWDISEVARFDTDYIIGDIAYILLPQDELAGTWVFNDVLVSVNDEDFEADVIFKSTYQNKVWMFDLFGCNTSGGKPRLIKYISGGLNLFVYDSDGWDNANHKTITVRSSLAASTNGDKLLAFLQANATKSTEWGETVGTSLKISATSPNGILLYTEGKYVDKPIKVVPMLEKKSVTPTTEEQVIVASDGYVGMSKVIVGAVAVPETEEWDGSGVVIEAIATEDAEDELAGTWVFKDTWGDGVDSEVNFTSNGETFDSISSNMGEEMYYRLDGQFVTAYMYGWQNEAYKTITITSKLSEVTNGADLLAWLKANATKQGAALKTFNVMSGATTLHTCQYEEGMTWQEFVDSEYNPDDSTATNVEGKIFAVGYVTSANNVICWSGGSTNGLYSINLRKYVTNDEVIGSDGSSNYEWGNPGGVGGAG